MTESLEQKVDLMKQEIDALQIMVTGQKKPWHKNASTLISVTALLFSFTTTYLSYNRTAAQDIHNTRQELRSLLQRMAALPKENVEIGKKYVDDPAAMNMISGFINQENTLLARQAAELARQLPDHTVSGAEYYAIAVALQSAYDLESAATFLDYSIAVTKDFNTEIAAIRMKANLKFIQGHPESGRVEYQRALDIFSKYPNYDPFTKASTNVYTELGWAFAEANSGSVLLAKQHAENADTLLAGLPRSPGANMLKTQVVQAKNQFTSGIPTTDPALGSQLGVVPASQSH
jgi:tetratricopeptide (TPR) repeat protein